MNSIPLRSASSLKLNCGLCSPAVPAAIWRYRALNELSPDSDPSDAGSPKEFDKLFDAMAVYYESNASAFNQDRFENDYGLYRDISSRG